MERIHIDKNIIAKFQAGDRGALQHIYQQTSTVIFNTIYRITLDQEDARDITQDTYITVYEKHRSFRADSSILTWLYRIAVNKALNFIAHKKSERHRAERIWQDPALSPASGEELSHEHENILFLKELLSRVTPEYRVCVVLRDIEDRSYEDIGKALGIAPGTVRSRINRGRAELARHYHENIRKEEDPYALH